MEELDEFGIPIKKQTSKVTLDEFGIPIKKKEQSVSTSTPQKSGSGTPTGSSGGVNPAFKSSIPSPIPDFNSVGSGKSVVEKQKTKLQKPPVKEDTSFFDYLKDNLDAGITTVSKSFYDAPGLVYDAAAAITNPIIKGLTGYEGEGASSEKLAKDLGFKNIPSEVLKEKIKISNDKINEYSVKNGGDALAALENGNYSGAAKLVAGTTMQSLPIMVAAMASGGQTSALAAIGVSTASTKNAQLKEERPEMELGTRVLNATNAGIIEAVTGHLFTGASGAVIKKILAKKGIEQGSKIISTSFKATVEKAIEKNPLVGAFGEIIEESAVEFGNQVNDMASGIRTEFDFHAIKNAGLSATGMGGVQTVAVYGAKGYVKAKEYAKLKSVNKEVFKLRSEIDNGNLSPENKAILSLRADRLEAENKKLLGTEMEKVKALPTEAKTELNALNQEFDDLKTKFDDIDDADDIPENLKPALKEEIRLQASKNQKRKTEILSQNDGLEVKGDFSKFDGVEPDFDLENGKISSLPLKEQNRLNKLAVEQITGGDKTIEYTKEQASQVANEIYANEQKPQAEAEKVDEQAVINNDEIATKNNNKVNDANDLSNGSNQEVSPVEDVVATSVEESKNQKDGSGNNLQSSYKRFDIKINNEIAGEIVISSKKNNENSKDTDYYEVVNSNVSEQNKGIGTNAYKELIKQLDKPLHSDMVRTPQAEKVWRKLEKEGLAKKTEDELGYESIPPTDNSTNGNVRPTATNVGESGITEQESPISEGVSKPVDGGEVKGDVEVSDLDYAKSQIEKGVLFWSGDSGAERVNLGISWSDIRKGEADIKKGNIETVPAKRLIEALKTAKEKGGYEYIQGKGGIVNKQFVSLEDVQRSSNEYELTDLEQKEIDANEYESARKYDEDFNSLTENEQIEILENYENSQDNSGTPSADSGQIQSKSDVSKEKEGGTGKSPTTKEKIAERIKLSDAKVDAKADAVKAKLKAFAAMFPSADINPEDYNINGFSTDAIVDMVAKAAKSLVATGIKLDEAIKQAIEGYNTVFDDEVDFEAVKQKITPKAEDKKADNDFKSQEGKKSLLNRAFEGGNSQALTDAIEANGLDYRIENREEAKKRAEDFVNQVGTASALEAVRSNQIKGAEKAFVYSTVVDNLMNEIENASNESDKQELEKIHADLIADLTNEFSQEGTDAGRFISALNDIYNSSALKYNLSKQIESHKAANNGEISDEVLAKFTEADKRIKELEKLIKEAEEKAKVAEDELAIKNVQEDVDRKKQLANKNKSGLTPREQTRKKELKNKFFGRLNDATSLITMLADPEFREYLGLTFKQAKGDLDNFSKRIIAELGKGAKAHLPKLFDEAEKSTPGKSTTIKIGKDGKIKIPAQLFRDYVEAGENDIDVIASKIKEDIANEFPDVDVRDIRDALSNYGKQVNPPKDDIVAEMSRLRSVGKLISAYEDALRGMNPLKSGLKKVKPTQQMRELRKEINRLIKENGLDAVDLEKEWASALDKVKSQLKNQIEDLDKQIAAGEKRKIERTITVLDSEADALKAVRDAKKQILDDLVGKPELTEEQLIARAEKSLQTSIDKLQKDIAEGKIEYNKKPTPKQSKKLDELRKQRNELVETKNKMREEAGVVEAKRLETAKIRVKNQIEDLKDRINNKDYSKKEVKPLIDDSELMQLRAEKLRQQEVYDAQKYKDELKNRTIIQKWSDAILELWNIERIIRATGELSTVLIQGGMLTVSRKFTNPKQLGVIMNKLFTSMGSAKKAEKMEGLIKAHPKYPLAVKAKLALANTDYKSDVREEQFTGDYANVAWDFPLLLSKVNDKIKKSLTKERSVLGDVLLNPIKKATGIGKVGTDKISIKDQWRNTNPFKVLERGSTLYMNTLRMEEFLRGVEMLEMEGKNEIDHLADYKLLANAINSMTGRANLPMEVATSSKALAVVFFSARNAVAVVNQVNPIYYGYLHFGSTDGFQMKKTSVANKLAVTNFMRFVTITGAMILAIKAGAGEDDEEKDVVEIELDPRSSDFMKIKIGNIRFDPWHGMTGPIVLMSKVLTEEVKNINSGELEKLEDKRFGDKNRFDLLSRFVRNKFSPSAARLANTLSTNAGIDPETGEAIRVTPFGENYETEGAFANVKPMYWDAVKEIRKENPGALAEFLTIVSTFGWNTAVYGQKTATTPEEIFLKNQEKKKAQFELPEAEKQKIRVDDKLSRAESKIKMMDEIKIAQQMKLPYYISKDVYLTKEEVADMDLESGSKGIEDAKKEIKAIKLKYKIKD